MSSYPYSEVIQGKTVYSNYPFDSTPPPGALVTMDLKFNTPISGLVTLGYDLLTILGQQTFQAQLVQQGYDGTVTNYSVYTTDAYTERIAFEMPVTATGVVPYLAPIIVFAIAAAVIIIAATIAWAIGFVIVGVAQAVAVAAPYILPVVAVLAAVGVAAFLYDFFKDSHYRKDVYREVGHTAKGVAKGAVHVAGSAAKEVERTGLSLARIRAKERVEKEQTAKEAAAERRQADMEAEERRAEREEKRAEREARKGGGGIG